MNKEQKMVQEFHERFGVLVHYRFENLDSTTQILRYDLIKEELNELSTAMMLRKPVFIADALADLLYVVYGTAVSYGIDMEPIFAEVHRSNMSKGDPEVIRGSNGKILKSKNWTPPNLPPLIIDAKPEEKP